MLWNSMFTKKNLLVSGICACPGIVAGNVYIWDNVVEQNMKEGDILLLLNLTDKLPFWAIQKSGAIISCGHTSYSHLTSFAMALNKPCIVGAVFSCLPENHSLVVVDSYKSAMVYSELNDVPELVMTDQENKWLLDVADKVNEKLYSKSDKPLAHVINLKGSEYYIDYISGIFFDSMIFQKELHAISDLKSVICRIHHQHPDIGIYYRFSSDVLRYKDDKSGLKREIEFVCMLQDAGIPIHVFVANASSYNDIVRFRHFISCICGLSMSTKVGTMIENKQIVDCLDSIVSDNLINFAAVGINDLMSSYLQLERDDPRNQENFRINTSLISNALIYISNVLTTKSIPYYIGFPKYVHFSADYELLNRFGYNIFFGTHSIFTIAQKYGRIREK